MRWRATASILKPRVETILEKRGVAIAASAIVFPLRAAARLSHSERSMTFSH
jgi:hypothetical protein